MADIRPFVTAPSGAVLAAGYGNGIAPASQGRGIALTRANVRAVPGPEHKPDLVVDEKHCSHVSDVDGIRTQCRSWPKKSSDQRLCVGHEAQYQKKVNDGAEPSGDEGLHQDAPRP